MKEEEDDFALTAKEKLKLSCVCSVTVLCEKGEKRVRRLRKERKDGVRKEKKVMVL